MENYLQSLLGQLSGGFSEQQKIAVWQKAYIVAGHDANVERLDSCGAWIKWADYGNRNSQFGWEIDHIYPKARGGTDQLSNLQALHWQNNAAKGDSTTGFTPAVIATA